VKNARKEGVDLMLVSGFWSKADQKRLFEQQVVLSGSKADAAKLIEPPGYSEHHTGYAVDLADAKQPETDLKLSFQETEAYRWFMSHAHSYGFEQSFAENNPHGVRFESWHWRLGSADALAERNKR
jgi:zinc D-Ala-D-Ala carboxypeptidase